MGDEATLQGDADKVTKYFTSIEPALFREDFDLVSEPLPAIKEGEILIKSVPS